MHTAELQSPNELNANHKQELWLPSTADSLDHHYPTPDTDELQLHWKGYSPTTDCMPAPGVYGVINELSVEQSETVVGFASIDLCEVLRNTAEAVMQIAGKSVADMDSVHSYGPAIGSNQTVVVPLVQVLMNDKLVEPIDDDIEIKKILKSWKKLGIYCVANTSTLPGCEASTLRFLSRNYDSCFDGILLPRNFDGTGPLSKGGAASLTLKSVVGDKEITAIHIDDAPHHNSGFVEAFTDDPHVEAFAFMPAYRGNQTDISRTTRTESSLESFVLANDLFDKKRKK